MAGGKACEGGRGGRKARVKVNRVFLREVGEGRDGIGRGDFGRHSV